MHKILWCIMGGIVCGSVSAMDFGTFGEVFPIQERSLLTYIQEKLKGMAQSGQLEHHQEKIITQIKERIQRPVPVSGIHRTTQPRTFTYDPSILVPYDIKDHMGNLIHVKGTRINPLEMYSMSRSLLFIDGDDSDQLTWALSEFQRMDSSNKPKIILIKGTPLDLSEQLGIPIYFDQLGIRVKKFGITQVPAHVSQKGLELQIEEIHLGGGK